MPTTNVRLQRLGERLKYERLRRNERQEMFAARIGASIPTLRRMEAGDPNVAIGYWMAALEILDRGPDLDKLLEVYDLFEKYEIQEAGKNQRQRAKRRIK